MPLKIIKEINISKSILLLIVLNILGLGLFFLSMPVFIRIGLFIVSWSEGTVLEEFEFVISSQDLILFIVTFIVMLVVHELIHGLFFKVFAPDRPVKYGFHWYALSASSPETKYPKDKFLWIGIAPFVLITAGFTILLAFDLVGISYYILLLSLHTAGCVGDFYFCLVLLFAPAEILVEDTGVGMILYQQE